MSTQWTDVEKAFIAISGRKESYSVERAPLIEVLNVYELGKIVALSFLEWVASNPSGVVALPTGKTPEYFIKTLERYKSSWETEATQKEIESYGFKQSNFPDTSRLRFVMLDEFFPMLPTHRNSFCNYINMFYTSQLNITSDNVLDFDLIKSGVVTIEEMKIFGDDAVDLTLLSREPTSEVEKTKKAILVKVQGFCDTYEKKVQALGGIGFFLGGIGPDGHIAFNQEGASHSSTTRLVNFNYPSAAAAASDLGGIEIARGKAAMTIGLGTISFNKQAKVIIMAAGEGKATVVRAGVEDPADPARPSSILHSLPNARFYVTHGAASKLSMRNEENISKIPVTCLDFAFLHLSGNITSDQQSLIVPPAEYSLMESCIYATSIKVKKAVHLLSIADMISLPEYKNVPQWIQGNELAFKTICSCASRRLKEKIEGGLSESQVVGRRILHTAPHHDDIMLSYHGAMHDMLGRQKVGTILPVGSREPLPTTHLRPRTGSLTTYLGNTLGEKHNDNLNHFAYLTSGFHSVNDDFLWAKVNAVLGMCDSHSSSFCLIVLLLLFCR